VIELLQSFDNAMNAVSLGTIAVTIIGALLLLPALVFIHELGHALMAKLLGHEVRELRVGDDDTGLAVHWGGFTLRLGPITGQRDYSGYVLYDGSRARLWHVLLIALAGPVASLAAGAAAAVAMVALGSHPFILMLAMLGGIEMGLANLSARASDGIQVRAAWRVLRNPEPPPPRFADAHEATSVAPPGY
jgi:membrane-associated protease RseP (regulator of RpoE activity)